MMKKRIAGLAVTLWFLSTSASAGVPNIGYSQDFDTGTLGTTHYKNNFSIAGDMVLHSYTFDLATPSRVDAWLFNPRAETGDIFGSPPLTHTLFDLSIFDSANHELYKGANTALYEFNSTKEAHVAGVLPAGDNYYVRIVGSQMNDVGLVYQFDMVATPVPEPETYAMFLAGLGLLGWRMRRKSN